MAQFVLANEVESNYLSLVPPSWYIGAKVDLADYARGCESHALNCTTSSIAGGNLLVTTLIQTGVLKLDIVI